MVAGLATLGIEGGYSGYSARWKRGGAKWINVMANKQGTGHDLGILSIALLLDIYRLFSIPVEHLDQRQRQRKALLIEALRRLGFGVVNFDDD